MATLVPSLLTQTQNNRVHLFRLQMLIIDGGNIVLRSILDQKLIAQRITLIACLNQEKITIGMMKTQRHLTQSQYDLLFPQSGTGPSTSDMDITLIISLLRGVRLFGFNKSFDWSKQPGPNDISIEADINRLKRYRNTMSHMSTTNGIQHNDFIFWWNDIEQLLIRLCPPSLNIQQTISDFKTCPLDPEEEIRIQKEINLWLDYEKHVNELKGQVQTVKDNLSKNLSDLKEQLNVVKVDLELVKRQQGTAVQSSTNTVDLQQIQSQSVTEETIYTRIGQVALTEEHNSEVTHTEKHANDLVIEGMRNSTTVSNSMQHVQAVNHVPNLINCIFYGPVTFGVPHPK